MNAKLSNFSELSNILSVKSSLRTNLLSLFTRFGLGHLLCRMSLEKQAGIPAVQLILSLCLFRIAGESIHSMHRKSYYGLLDTGHNCYYRMMRRATMDWRRLLLGMALRFLAIFRKEHTEVSSDNATYLTTLRWRREAMAWSLKLHQLISSGLKLWKIGTSEKGCMKHFLGKS